MNVSVAARKKVVKQAEANQRLEGLKVSKTSLGLAGNYVVGKASAKETATKIRNRYGIK